MNTVTTPSTAQASNHSHVQQQVEEQEQHLKEEGHNNKSQEGHKTDADSNNNNITMAMEPCMLVPRPTYGDGDNNVDVENDSLIMSSLFPPSPPAGADDSSSNYHNSSYYSYYEELRDKLSIMKRLEETTYSPVDYLPHRTQQRYKQRRMTVEYLYQVIDYGNFQRDVVTYSMTHLLDRYLAAKQQQQQQHANANATTNKHKSKSKCKALENPNQYQLVALTCLYMGVKLLEPQNIGVDSLVPLANGMYSRDQFVEMETSILQTLDWYVAEGPTPLAFVQLLMPFVSLSLSSSSSSSNHINTTTTNDAATTTTTTILTSLYNHVQYQCELGVSDYDICCAKPSDIAIAAMWNGLESLVQASLLSHQQQCRIQQCILRDALCQQQQSEQQQRLPSILTQYHLTNLQTKLRHLMMAAYSSFTTTATPSTTTTAAAKSRCSTKREGKSGQRPEKVGRSRRPTTTTTTGDHHDSSPASSCGQNSFNDVAEVDWLQYT